MRKMSTVLQPSSQTKKKDTQKVSLAAKNPRLIQYLESLDRVIAERKKAAKAKK